MSIKVKLRKVGRVDRASFIITLPKGMATSLRWKVGDELLLKMLPNYEGLKVVKLEAPIAKA